MEVEKQEKLVMTGRNKKTSNELSLKFLVKNVFLFSQFVFLFLSMSSQLLSKLLPLRLSLTITQAWSRLALATKSWISWKEPQNPTCRPIWTMEMKTEIILGNRRDFTVRQSRQQAGTGVPNLGQRTNTSAFMRKQR